MESYRSTFIYELSDNVLSPLKKLKKRQTRTSESDSDSNESTTSNVSFKSDQSKEEIGNFKGKLSPRVPLKHKASTGSKCSSIKTDRSQDFINAKKRWSRKEISSSSEDEGIVPDDVDQMDLKKAVTRTSDSDSDSDSNESTTSNVSFKSDQSKEENGNFKGKLSPRVPLKHKASTGSKCSSIKTDRSQDFINAKKRWSRDEEIMKAVLELEKAVLELEKAVTRTSESDSDSNESTTSNVSFKSDQSKEENGNFKGKLSPRVPLKHKASTGSKCSSIKTDRSQDFINAKKRWSREKLKKELTRTSESDSDSNESTTSNVSFKSYQSKEENGNFKGKLSPRVPLKHKASTGSKCSSIKTDRSQDFINAKKRWSRKEISSSSEDEGIVPDDVDQTRTRTSDSDRDSDSNESITSNVSFKSNWSKEDSVYFKESSPTRSEKERSGEEDIDFRRDQSKEVISVKEKRFTVRLKDCVRNFLSKSFRGHFSSTQNILKATRVSAVLKFNI